MTQRPRSDAAIQDAADGEDGPANVADRAQDNRGTGRPSNPAGVGEREATGEGPPLPPRTTPEFGTLQASRAECRRIARTHYENFLVATVLLPRPLRQPFFDVYAFCRTADDAADESASPEEAGRKLAGMQAALDATFRGTPPPGIYPALAETIGRFGLVQRPFDDLLEAFRQDQVKVRYGDWEELLGYCRKSADPVGRIVLKLAEGWRGASLSTPEHLELSDRICTGLQLANHWQDVARDYRAGRVYLPADAMRRYSVTESMLSLPSAPTPFRTLLRELCDRAEAMLREGLPLADRVPRWLSADLRLFAHGGLETIRAIRAIDYDVLRRRPTVGRRRQLVLLSRAVLGRL